MAVSNKIAQLTALALKDRFLTFVERQTIVKAAMEEGATEEEIDAYLNKALERRVQTYSKEELMHCPCCGGQVPLISDECFYCGAKLNSAKHVSEDINISGVEADIIRGENAKTAYEQQNPTNCPDCGAPFPLISNICTSCGHVLHAQKDSDVNIKKLIDNINKSIKAIQEAPLPTFKDVLRYNRSVILLFAGTILLVIAFSYPTFIAGLMIIGAIVLMVLCVKQLIKRKEDVSPVTVADEAYYTALNKHNMYVRLTKSIYGDNAEAKEYIATLGDKIKVAERNRKKNRSKLLVLFMAIVFAGLLLLAIRPSVDTYYDEYLENDYTIFKTEKTAE